MIRTHLSNFPTFSDLPAGQAALTAYLQGEQTDAHCIQLAKELRLEVWGWQRHLTNVSVGDFAWWSRMRQYQQCFGLVSAEQLSPASPLQQQIMMHYGSWERAQQEYSSSSPKKTFHWDSYADFEKEMTDPVDSQTMALQIDPLLQMLDDAQRQGYKAKPVILGPVSLLYSCQLTEDIACYLPVLIKMYRVLLERVHLMGVEWIQFDEPISRMNVHSSWQQIFLDLYLPLAQLSNRPQLLLSVCGSILENQLGWLYRLPIDALHIDMLYPEQHLRGILQDMPLDWELSLGVTRLDEPLALVQQRVQSAIEIVCQNAAKRIWFANAYAAPAENMPTDQVWSRYQKMVDCLSTIAISHY